MKILNIVTDMSNVSVRKRAVLKFQGLRVRNRDFFIERRKSSTMLQIDRMRVDKILNIVIDISNVSVHNRCHVKVSMIKICGSCVYALCASNHGFFC
jgi:hypothetical protein